MKFRLQYLPVIMSCTAFCMAQNVYALTAKKPCEDKNGRSAIHCDFLTPNPQMTKGKYVKLKEVKKGKSSISTIFCAAPNGLPIMSIPQHRRSTYQVGETVAWQFSQCMDDDCVASKSLADDRFTILAAGNSYSSSPKKTVEITLDPTYGSDCEAVDKPNNLSMLRKAPLNVTLQDRIDDAANLLESIPTALDGIESILTSMRQIAESVANGANGESLNPRYQQLLNDITKMQRVATLDGYKTIGQGSAWISLNGMFSSASSVSLVVPMSSIDLWYVGIYYTNVLNQSEAYHSMDVLNNAIQMVDQVIYSS